MAELSPWEPGAASEVTRGDLEAAEAKAVPLAQKGVAGGVGTLDAGGRQPAAQLYPLAITGAPSPPIDAGENPTDAHTLKASRNTYGTADNAVVASLIANRTPPTTQVMGTTDPAVSERGSVVEYVSNSARPPTVDSTKTTFTANSVTFEAGVDVSKVVKGMTVDVGGNGYVGGGEVSAFVTGVEGQKVNVLEWRTEAFAKAATPANGSRVRVDRVNKIWALGMDVNSTEGLKSPLADVAMAGIEMDVQCDFDYGAIGMSDAEGRHAIAFDAFASTAWKGRPTIAYSARGKFLVGFASSGPYSAEGHDGAHFMAHRLYEVTPNKGVVGAFYDSDSASGYSFYAKKSAEFPNVFAALYTTDTTNRFELDRDGKMRWGPGGVTAVDTNLYRSAAGQLATDFAFVAKGNIGAAFGTASQIIIGEKQGPENQLGISFGQAADTKLYRREANFLETAGAFAARSSLAAKFGDAGGAQVVIGSQGPGGEAGLSIGNAADVRLYRKAAGVLKTGAKLLATGGFGVGNAAAATGPVGAVVKKIEVFDSEGASLGFIPVYNAIT